MTPHEDDLDPRYPVATAMLALLLVGLARYGDYTARDLQGIATTAACLIVAYHAYAIIWDLPPITWKGE